MSEGFAINQVARTSDVLKTVLTSLTPSNEVIDVNSWLSEHTALRKSFKSRLNTILDVVEHLKNDPIQLGQFNTYCALINYPLTIDQVSRGPCYKKKTSGVTKIEFVNDHVICTIDFILNNIGNMKDDVAVFLKKVGKYTAEAKLIYGYGNYYIDQTIPSEFRIFSVNPKGEVTTILHWKQTETGYSINTGVK